MRLSLPCLLALASITLGPCPAAPSAEGDAGASFATAGVAFLEKHCVRCHGEKVQKSHLALHVFRDEASVLKGRKTWEEVLQRVRAGEMPPKSRPRPAAAEIKSFTRVVEDLFARADRDARPDPGRVTVRRLNRTEYNNTIRDLVGVDFQPAEDFPSDDVGHGFDNIGDVLTVSPVLLERYLAAAESIVGRAIVVGAPPKPPRRPTAAQFLFPRSSVREPRFRTLDAKGEFFTFYKLSIEGEYRLRVRAWGNQVGDEPVKLALLLDGKEVYSAPVKAVKGKPDQYESGLLTLKPGSHRAAVAFLNPYTDPKAAKRDEATRSLSVTRLELEGPMDTYPASHKRIMACTPGKPWREQAREILSRFASKAYRRPASDEEVGRLLAIVDAVEKRGDKWEEGIRLALQAVLVSPKFLFRLELDDSSDAAGPHPLDEYQLASRLSYFLWSTMPDDRLFELAAKKALTANLDSQVRRMLGDPRAQTLVENFALQWLQLRRLKMAAPDPKLFPSFNEKLRSAMFKETELFVGAVFREDRSILDLIDADFTFLNETIAHHYGIADTNGNLAGQKPTRPVGDPIYGEQFRRVRLPNGARGGLLMHASVLTVTSNPTRTSPVKRGKWVLEQILGTPPPPPPPDVPELPENAKAVLSGSLRQRMEQHRANPNCAVCHARMDALGFAFENFDAIGAFRTKDGEFPIDPSGTLPDGRSFAGPQELKHILKAKKELFAHTLAEKLLTYALGRGLEYYDRPAVNRIVSALGRDDYRFSTLVLEIARSDPFGLRRGKEEAK
jgi:mono/diheme cytochrome c family protein